MDPRVNSVLTSIDNNDRSTINHQSPLNEGNRRILPIMLSLLFLITLLVPRFIGGNAEEYTSFCQLRDYPEVTLLKDKWGSLRVDSGTSLNESDLFNSTFDVGDEEIHSFKAKECRCAKLERPQYCLVDQGDTCGIPRDKNSPVGCFFLDSRTVFIRNAWPVVLLWYGALILFLFATENGRNARNYLISLCIKSRNLSIADDIVSREIQLRDQMRLAAMAQQRRVMELARVRREEENPTLILKTKTYCSPRKSPLETDVQDDVTEEPLKTPQKRNKSTSFDNNPDEMSKIAPTSPSENNSTSFVYNEHEEEVTCTICIVPIEDGDRVGALPCNHLFHSACLKQWIKRRNVCPLCQEPDIATPQRNTNTNSRTNYPQVRDNINDLETVGQFGIVTNTISDWSPRGQSLILNTESNMLVGSPVPPPPPRARGRRLQRLTLTEDGDVQITQLSQRRARRDVHIARERVLRFVSNHRNRIRHNDRDRSRVISDLEDQGNPS